MCIRDSLEDGVDGGLDAELVGQLAAAMLGELLEEMHAEQHGREVLDDAHGHLAAVEERLGHGARDLEVGVEVAPEAELDVARREQHQVHRAQLLSLIHIFDDEEDFVRECVRTNAIGNVYVGIQPRPRRLFDAAPNVVRPLKTGAGRKDIEVITATVIDLDPARPKDTASTDAELALAMAAANEASAWCESCLLYTSRCV